MEFNMTAIFLGYYLISKKEYGSFRDSKTGKTFSISKRKMKSKGLSPKICDVVVFDKKL